MRHRLQPKLPPRDRGLQRQVACALLVLAAFVAGLVWSAPAAAADGAFFVVVAHPDLPIDSVDRAQVSDAFLRKLARWQDGTPVHPVTLKDETVRESFARIIHGRSDHDIRKHWQRQVFTGRGTPPLERDSSEQVLEYVRETPGAIGFVNAQANVRGVKVLKLQ